MVYYIFMLCLLAVALILLIYPKVGPLPKGKVELCKEGIFYHNGAYSAYMAYSSATGVEMHRRWDGRRLTLYGVPSIDFREPHLGTFGVLYGMLVKGESGGNPVALNRYEDRLEIYPSKYFDIEKLYRDLLLKGIPAMRTVKLSREG